MIALRSKRRRQLIFCFAFLTHIGVAERAVAAPLGAIIKELSAAGESFGLRSPEQQDALLEAAAEATRMQLVAVPHAGLKSAEADLVQIVRLARELEKTGEPKAYMLGLALRYTVDFAVVFEMVREDAVAGGRSLEGPHVNGSAGPEVVDRVLRVSDVPGQSVLAFVMKSPSSCAHVLREAGVSPKDLWKKGAELLPSEARKSAERDLRCRDEGNGEGELEQALLYDWLFWGALGAIDKARDARTVAMVYAEGGWQGDYDVLEKGIIKILEETPRSRLSTGRPDYELKVLSIYDHVAGKGLADYERRVAIVLRKALSGREVLNILKVRR